MILMGIVVMAEDERRKPAKRIGDREITHTDSPVIVDDVRRNFYYVGWRWDL
jgi:hypothetical protein